MHVHVCKFTHTHTHTHIHTHTHTRARAHARAHSARIHVRACIVASTHKLGARARTHTHTYTHTHSGTERREVGSSSDTAEPVCKQPSVTYVGDSSLPKVPTLFLCQHGWTIFIGFLDFLFVRCVHHTSSTGNAHRERQTARCNRVM